MRWLGQYIQDFIARFRNDIYLENISSGTIVRGGNLGLDSNNKIVKADIIENTIKLLPTDFMQNEDGGVNKSVQYIDDTTIGVRASDGGSELF